MNGWAFYPGAGGYFGKHVASKWSTNVYLTRAEAECAAAELEERAKRALDERQRLAAELRKAFTKGERDASVSR